MKPERAGDLYALACAFVCGLGNIPAKAALENLSTELYTLIFFIFAFVISGFSLFRKKDRDEIIKIDFKTLSLIFALSILFTIGLFLFMTSLKLIDPTTVNFLSRFQVIVTVVLAYMILKERLRFIEIIGGIIAVVGVAVLKYKTNLAISHAATLMVISAFFFAAAEIIIKKNIKRLGTMRFLFYRNFFMIFMIFIILLVRDKELYLPDSRTIFLTLIAAILLPVLGRITYLEALKRINISRAALISTITPLFTALFAFLILSTYPMPVEWLGGGLIVIGVIVIKLTETKFNSV